jgi:hypothetical protein
MRFLASLIAATVFAGYCNVRMAAAEDNRSFEGRWTAENRSLTLDMFRCGNGWCGIEVTAAGSCGRTVLRTSMTESGLFIGRLELAAQAQPYTVSLLHQGGPGVAGRLLIHGDSSDTFHPARRVFPYMVAFARTGDTACRPDPKVS